MPADNVFRISSFKSLSPSERQFLGFSWENKVVSFNKPTALLQSSCDFSLGKRGFEE